MTNPNEQHHDHHQPNEHGHGNHQHAAATATDPVCGMKVEPHTAKHRTEHAGRTYYFCSAKCREKFIANPVQYVKPSEQPRSAAAQGTIYTCPMHPQIRRSGREVVRSAEWRWNPSKPALRKDRAKS